MAFIYNGPIRVSALVISFLMLLIITVCSLIIIVVQTAQTLAAADILSIMQTCTNIC